MDVHHVRNADPVFQDVDEMQMHPVFVGKLISIEANWLSIVPAADHQCSTLTV